MMMMMMTGWKKLLTGYEKYKNYWKFYTAYFQTFTTLPLDINDLFTNIPIIETRRITNLRLKEQKHDEKLIEQMTRAVDTILEQNYFQHNSHIYRPKKCIAMGSLISSIMSEVYLQHIENTYLKQAMDNKEIVYYRRYVGDLFLIYEETKINADTILEVVNKLDRNITFKVETEDRKVINYLDLNINRTDNKFNLGIYRKPTAVDITINFTSNHPYMQKLAAFQYLIHRLNSLPITLEAKEKERQGIVTTPNNNNFQIHIIHQLNNRKRTTTCRTEHSTPSKPKKWSRFQFRSLMIYKMTNFFKNTNIKVAFKATNTIFQQLTRKPQNNNPAGIYRIKCNTCRRSCVGQTGRNIATRHKEHTR
jgi:hypothetical protein